MFYMFDQNKFCQNLQSLKIEDYQFYKDGCKINEKKGLQILLKSKQKPLIVVKQKIDGNIANRSNQKEKRAQLKKIQQKLAIQDREQFEKNLNILFEEWKKFKYIHGGEGQLQLAKQQIEQLQQLFLKQGRQIFSRTSQQLEYVTKNWRQFIKAVAHAHN